MHSTAAIKDRESDQVYALHERVRELEGLLGLRWPAPVCLKLTPKQAEVLGAILVKPSVRSEALYALLYGADPDPPQPKVIAVLVSQLRSRLRPHGVEISSGASAGYHITPDNLEKLNALYGPGERA